MAILTPPVHMTALLSRKLGITHRLRIGLSWLLKNPDSEGEWNLCGASRVYFQCVCVRGSSLCRGCVAPWVCGWLFLLNDCL